MIVRRVFASWDFGAATATMLIMAGWLPKWVPNDLAKDYYGVGISVLSILFPLFFAALAIIISATDDEFVKFLEEQGLYTALVTNFKISLWLLFGALVYSLSFYAYTATRISGAIHFQRKAFLVIFTFFFLWSIFAAFASTIDAIKYSQNRKKYMDTLDSQHKQQNLG